MVDFDRLEKATEQAQSGFKKKNKVYEQADLFENYKEFSEKEVAKLNRKFKSSVQLKDGSIEQIAKCSQELLAIVTEETKTDKLEHAKEITN